MDNTRTPSVNLLKTKGNTFTDKFISWALTIGRMVIILTETIALVAFLYRFVLDRQLIDQKDRINQKSAQVKLYEASEKNFRNLQSRLDLITKIQNQSKDQTTLLTDIINNTPKGVTFNNIGISPEAIRIDLNVQSVNALTTFVNKLKQNPTISSISIDRIENKTRDVTIGIGIKATLKNTQVAVKKQHE